MPPTGPDRASRRERERRRRRAATIRLALVALLLAGLLAAAFALGRSSGGSDDGEQPVVVDCVQRVETLDKWPREGWEADAVEAGPVVFYGARHAAREEAAEDGSVSTELPVLVDAEQQVTIRAHDGVRLGFGSEERAAEAVTFKACPEFEREPGTPRRVGKFTQFVGSFTADEPTCVELELTALGDGEPREARFGLGQECD